MPEIIYSDLKRFRQIVFNLVGNAVKFTFKGAVTLALDFVDNVLVSSVEDTGIGIQ